jgi:hypothetical protein
MPQRGERRVFGDQVGEWDGQGWTPVTADPPPAESPSAVSRFASGLWQNVNPMGLVDAVRHPVDTAGQLLSAQVGEFRKAAQAPTVSEMIGHGAAGLLPIVGPVAARAGETIAGGDIAGGLGQATGLLAPFGVDAAVSGIPKALPTAVADVADRAAVGRLVDQTGPKVGPNKVRFNQRMAEAAPALLRDPELGAFSREGLHAKVQGKLAAAVDAMDSASDTRLASQQVKTAPIVQRINQEIARLTAEPVEASQAVPRRTNLNAAGQDTVLTTHEAQPYGEAVQPGPNQGQIATLATMRDEVARLGPVAPYESVRRIRQAWDQVAKVKFLPATAQDALKAQGDASAAVAGTGAMREALAQADPASAAAYKSYSLYKAADDVLRATHEAEQARPRVGRSIMARGVGAMVGATEGGVVGAGVGPLLAA